MTSLRLLCGAALVAMLSACGEPDCEDPVAPPAPAAGIDIKDQIGAIPSVASIVEQTSRYPGQYRLFVMQLNQPVDYCAPKEGRFQQMATLLYRDAAAPMVFRTAGYGISLNPTLSEPAALLNANQLTLEHRFFRTSAPDPIDWSKLTVVQAAHDHHRAIESFRRLFPGKWLTTGASKDGMTAVFHRYFYPNDVDATVAYVAPLMFSLEDDRFPPFLASVGDATCRDALKTYQRTLLQRRAEVEPEFTAWGNANGQTFNALGLSKAYDFSTLESGFTFWQYGTASMCPTIPGPSATPAELFQLLLDISAVPGLTDSSIDYYTPYFYQSAVELGGPALPQDHLLDLTGGVPIGDVPENYPPLGVAKNYDSTLMRQVGAWMTQSAPRILLVYGGNDPWTAGAMTVSAANDSHRYNVAGGNHASRMADLPEPQHSQAVGYVTGWMSAPPPAPDQLVAPERLTELEEMREALQR